MNQNKVIDIITTEIIQGLGLPIESHYDFVQSRVKWLYIAGIEEGKSLNPKNKKIVQLTLNGEYIKLWDGALVAAKAFKIHNSAFYRCANKVRMRHTSGGYRWEWYRDYKKRIAEEDRDRINDALNRGKPDEIMRDGMLKYAMTYRSKL